MLVGLAQNPPASQMVSPFHIIQGPSKDPERPRDHPSQEEPLVKKGPLGQMVPLLRYFTKLNGGNLGVDV